MDHLTDDEIKNRIAAKVKKLYANKKKKYVCEFCGTGFNKRDFLVSHMKIRHPDLYDKNYGTSNYASLNPELLQQLSDQPGSNQMDSSPTVGGQGGANQTVPPAGSTPISAESSPSPANQPSMSGSMLSNNGSMPQSSPSPSSSPSSSSSASMNTTPPAGMMQTSPGLDSHSLDELNVNFSMDTIPPASMAQLENQLDGLNESLEKTMKVMSQNMQMLNKELKYLIAEYKSPFIVFD